jgi:hypothetical protein
VGPRAVGHAHIMGPAEKVVVVVAVVVRLAAATILLAGPWNDPARLDGWDVARFQQIADEPGRPWRDVAVEYPPGSVLLIEWLAVDDEATLHDRLVLVGLASEALVIGGVAAAWGRRAAVAALALGTVLVPMGYVRLDLVAVALAVWALAADRRGRPLMAGALLTAGFLVKIWPVVLVAVLVARRSHRSVAVTLGGVGAAVLAWLACAGLDGPAQVIGFRGATGWHVESLPGALVALLTGHEVALESGAFRIGTAWWPLRLATLLASASVLVVVARRRVPTSDRTDAASASAAVAALLAGSALLSPQYLLWLAPFAAATLAARLTGGRPAAGAVVITGLTLAVVAPPGLGSGLAPWLLTARNACLVVAVVVWVGGRHATETSGESSRVGAGDPSG